MAAEGPSISVSACFHLFRCNTNNWFHFVKRALSIILQDDILNAHREQSLKKTN